MPIIHQSQRPAVAQRIYTYTGSNPEASLSDAVIAALPIVGSPGGVTVMSFPTPASRIASTAATIVRELAVLVPGLDCTELITAMTALVPVQETPMTADVSRSSVLAFGNVKDMPITLPSTAVIDFDDRDEILDMICCFPTDGGAGFALELPDRYVRLSVNTNGVPDFHSAFSESGTAIDIAQIWAQRIQKLAIAMTTAWNSAINNAPTKTYKPYAELEAAIFGCGIPTIMLRALSISAEYTEKEAMEDGQTVVYPYLSGVSVRRAGEEASVYHYLNAVYAKYNVACFKRLDEAPPAYSNDKKAFCVFDINPYMVDTPTPLGPDWVDYAARYTEDEWETFLAFIWGVVYAKNKSRQLLNIFDPQGYAAKSVLALVVARVIGKQAVRSINKDSLTNQFGYSKIHDARLVIAADSKNPHLVHSEKIHSITGGDLVDVEYKGKRSFTQQLRTKVMVCSNIPMEIEPSLRHEISRIIVIKPVLPDHIIRKLVALDDDGNPRRHPNGDLVFVGDGSFEDRLVEQAPSFLINAYQAYKRLCPTDTEIIVPSSVYANALDLGNSASDEYEACLGVLGVLDSSAVTPAADLRVAIADQVADHAILRGINRSNDYANFIDWLTRVKGCRKTRRDHRGVRTMVILGIRLKEYTVQSRQRSDNNFAGQTVTSTGRNVRPERSEFTLRQEALSRACFPQSTTGI